MKSIIEREATFENNSDMEVTRLQSFEIHYHESQHNPTYTIY